MILASFFRAIQQLTDPRFIGVVAWGIALTLLLFISFYVGLTFLIRWLVPATLSLPLIGEITWIDNVLTVASVPIMLALSAILMLPVASMFMGLFLDRVAEAVEELHYPNLPSARGVPLWEALKDSLRLFTLMVTYNLLALVGYISIPPLAPLVFWAVNGLLLGREYGQLVALRRMTTAQTQAFRKHNRGTLFAAGILMAIALTIPVVNLLVPVLGAATFTHLFHELNRRSTPSQNV